MKWSTFRASLSRPFRPRAEAELVRAMGENHAPDCVHAIAAARTLEAMGFSEERAIALCCDVGPDRLEVSR